MCVVNHLQSLLPSRYPNTSDRILSLFQCLELDTDTPPYAEYAVARGMFLQAVSAAPGMMDAALSHIIPQI
jgi:hypothetical protein